jgi:uncharacterized protein
MKLLCGLGAAVAASVLFVPVSSQAGAGIVSVPVQAKKVDVTIESANGPHVFHVELARTTAEQERGLMYRTNLPWDGGMIFTPYPAEGEPREASFWMKNTPTALDILFIRADGTIARIGENAVPFSEDNVKSGEPVAAVLEIHAGVSARLGIKAGDKVRWAKQ